MKLELNPEQIAMCIEQVGIGFMFAPMHHSCMKHAIGPRKELAVRTLFNLLGPLTNPASAQRQVLGVFDEQWLVPLAHVLKSLSTEHALVVNAQDGLDEISISSPTNVCELKHGEVKCYQIKPEDFGFKAAPIDAIQVEDAQQSAILIKSLFDGEAGAAADIVSLNAGAAIYVSGQVDSLLQGVELAQQKLKSGAAKQTLNQLIEFTNRI